jgi:hypothetical protein
VNTSLRSETITMFAYRFMGFACIVGLIANVTKHGFHLSGILWPVLLSVAMFSLGVQPKSRLQESGKWAVRYLSSVMLVLFLLGTVVYQRFLR